MKATGLWRNDIRQSQSVRNSCYSCSSAPDNGQFETHPGSQSEVVCDIHLVLQIERKLLVLHVRQELGTVPGVGISDTESSRSSVVHKIIPRGIDIITATRLHESVHCLIGLKLDTAHKVMDTAGEIEFIGNDKGLHLAQVPFCKGSGPNEAYSEPWSRMSTVGNVPPSYVRGSF